MSEVLLTGKYKYRYLRNINILANVLNSEKRFGIICFQRFRCRNI